MVAALVPSLAIGRVALSAAWHPAGPQLDLTTPEGVYSAGCQYCHAADGRGVDLSTVAFDTPLPDFSDCAFATREPDADWFAITHQGGPVRAFNQSMPAFYEGFTDEQIEMAVQHLRTFCTDDRWPRGELNLPRPLYTEKAYPEDEAVYTFDASTDSPGEVHNEFTYEKRIGPGGQVEIKLPIDFAQEASDGAWAGGFGDIEVGYKQTLAHSLEKGFIISAGGAVILPTGDSDRGLGSGVTKIEPFAAAGIILPADAFIHLLGGAELSTDTEKADHEGIWRGVIGKTFTAGRFGRSWTPMLEMLGTSEFGDDGTENLVDLVPQVQVSLNTRQQILANFGVRFPVNEREGRATRVAFYILWDWYDGGFFDGW
ncbi:MAG: c-type cytochrome [Acidobacteriota bacterium]|jgi:hypothetical protein